MGWRLALLLGLAASAQASSVDEVVRRLEADVDAGRPLVAHVVVALADNEFQGIVPVVLGRRGRAGAAGGGTRVREVPADL